MFGRQKRTAKFQSFVTPELVEQALASDQGPVPLPPASVIPYALIQVQDDPIELIRDRIDEILTMSEIPGIVAKEIIFSSIVLVCVPWTGELRIRSEARDEVMGKVTTSMGIVCRSVVGNIHGRYGVLSYRNRWFGLLAPKVDRLFASLLTAKYGEVVYLDLP